MRKYSCTSRGKGAIYFPDAGKEFADKDLVKIMRKALQRTEGYSIQARLTVYPHMITVDTWQYES